MAKGKSAPSCAITDVTVKNRTYDLEARTVRAALSAGFVHEDTLRFEMSRRFGPEDDEIAFEPAFVFCKPE